MKTVYKYPLVIDDYQKVTLPIDAKLLCIKEQNGKLCLWALINKEETCTEQIIIRCAGTGHPIKENVEYINSIMMMDGNLVFHFFKVIEGKKKLTDKDKIEPKFKVGDIIKPKDRGHEPWQIMQVDILDKKYRFKDGYVIHFSQEDNYELVEQNAWSEEDDIMVHDIDYALRCQITYPISKLQSMSNWIFNLKDRVHPQSKQNWSEEDERIFSNINLYIRKAGDYPHFNKENIKEAINWLKFFKNRIFPQLKQDSTDRFFEGFKKGEQSVIENYGKYGLCKFTEWNEEEKKMLDEMYEFFDKHKIPSLKHDMDDYAKFIKSLKNE